MIIQGKNNEYEIVVGIEVHAQIKSNAKLFSGSRAGSENEPNEDVSFFDIASPGKMPVLNDFIIKQAVKTGLALNAEINPNSIFDRKHYFYPDLPSGYQITQFYEPIIRNGHIIIELENGTEKKIRINRAHIEQDAGKLIHDLIPGKTVVDLNRSGVPLLEIVSEPDIQSIFEACEYIKALRAILRSIETCAGDMEKGELRCDINISVRPKGSEKFGTRCEIKNVNSIKFVGKAIEYEAQRQVEEIEGSRAVKCETRLFDAVANITKTMREKETEADYRYIPEPDLKSVIISNDFINKIKNSLPELPLNKIKRYKKDFSLSQEDAAFLASENEISFFFEEVVKNTGEPKLSANWITSELFALLNKANINISASPIKPSYISSLINMITKEEVSGKMGKEILTLMFESKKSPEEIVKEKGMMQITNPADIEKIIDSILEKHSEKVQEYKLGKTKLLGFFTGEIMKVSSGKVNPAITNQLLLKKLSS